MSDFNGYSIPTTYKGINFRSRLEAKYAVMFDQLYWSWEYEPVDLKGWIPDFVIKGVKPIYVEVKPVWLLDEVKELGKEIEAALNLKDDWWGNEPIHALICGAHLPQNVFDSPGLGWLWDGHWSPSHVFELSFSHNSSLNYAICHDTNSYMDRITGIGGGDHHMGDAADLESMWRNAGNLVQWKPAPAGCRQTKENRT